jgi:hypothetical protein
LTTVTLDGTGSFDPDGDRIYYSWTLQRPAGSWASIFSQDAATTSFQTDVEGTYVATLEVWDGLIYSSDSVTIIAPNRAPVVVAGADRDVMRNTIVTVSSVGTNDPDNDTIKTISFSLERPAGSAAVLEFNGWYDERTFRPDVVGVYTVTVTASDGKLTASHSVVLTAVNAAPEVTVTAVAAVNAPERVDVASSSQDRNNDTLTRAWRLVAPPASAATLSATTGTTTSYVPDVPGTYTVYFDVSDGFVTTTVSRETVVHPRVLKLAHDMVEAVCNDFCSTIYMASSSPANELWRFFVVPGTAETKLAALSGPALALGSTGDGPAVGMSGKVGAFIGMSYTECPLPQWTDSSGTVRTYDAGGVAIGPAITVGPKNATRTARFVYVVPAATANGGKDLLSVDMSAGGGCAVTAAAGPLEGFDGAVALRPGTSSLYAIDASSGLVRIYDVSTGPATLTTTATISGEPRRFWFMDGGARFVTPEGTVYGADVVDGAIPLAGELGNPAVGDPKHLAVHASSSAAAARIAAIPATGLSATPLDVQLRTYDANTLDQLGALALPAIVKSGTVYPARGRFAAHRTPYESTVWVIERSEPGVTPEAWGLAPLDP